MAQGRGSDSPPVMRQPETKSKDFDFSRMLGVSDALPMGVAYLDRDRRYRFANKLLAGLFALDRAAMIGRTIDELLGPEAMKLRAPLLAAAYRGEEQHFAADFDHPTRGRLAIESHYLPQIGDDGSVEGIVILLNDVTEHRAAEQAIRESEARFRRIADSAPVMMWETAADGSREFVNDAYAEFFGLDREQAAALDWRNAVHPDDLEELLRADAEGEATGEPYMLIARYRRFDGEYRWLQSVSHPRTRADGSCDGMIGVATDITVSKQAEIDLKGMVDDRSRDLAESESRFRAIFDSLEMVATLTLDGELIEVNRAALELMEATNDDVAGQHVGNVPFIRDLPESRSILDSLVAQARAGETATAEVPVEQKGKRGTHIVTIKRISDRAGRPVGLVLEARDITELKATQDQLRQAQKMEALGQLTGGIAHDFNNLLTVIMGGLDIIAKQVQGERLRRYAKNALTAAERGAKLTAQLLAFSRVQKLEVRPVRVAPLIEAMKPLIGNVTGGTIEKRFELAADEFPIMADPIQLELAILNLAINARDAMPNGGELAIALKPVSVEGDSDVDDGDYLEIRVCDTGTGMDADTQSRAFEPFFTTKGVGKGTGLGLSMAYGLARQSRGIARISSEPGEGTTVSLLFPKSGDDDPEQRADQARQQQRIYSPEASVLVVDDHSEVRQFLVESLSDKGFEMFEAESGAEGIAIQRQRGCDLVILDFAMPGMSGDEAARAILAENPDQPLLFVTGYSESEAIRVSAPEARVLSKPFRSADLERVVDEILSARKAR